MTVATTASATKVASLTTSLLLSVLLAFLSSLSNLECVIAGGAFQSGPNKGSIYAGGLDYVGDSVYITGITYDYNGNKPTDESSCFVSKLNSRYLQHHDVAISSTIGYGDVMEVCYGISLLHDPLRPVRGEHKPFVVSGTSDPGGIYGSSQDIPSGFVMSLNPSVTEDFTVQGGLSIDEAGQTNTVSYPVSILYEFDRNVNTAPGTEGTWDLERKDGQIFIASLSSVDLDLSPTANSVSKLTGERGQKYQPNWMEFRKYGKSFEMTLHRFITRSDIDNDGVVGLKIEEDWTETYPIDIDPDTGDKPDVYLAGMIRKKIPNHPGASDNSWLAELEGSVDELLIVAGSTRGMGLGYGDAQYNSDDEDGFISVISTETGKLISGGNKSNRRIGTAETDLILGICDDPTDPNAFYIVGATGGRDGMGERVEQTVYVTNPKSLHGFVQKIQLDTLDKIWGFHWGANHMGDHMGEFRGDNKEYEREFRDDDVNYMDQFRGGNKEFYEEYGSANYMDQFRGDNKEFDAEGFDEEFNEIFDEEGFDEEFLEYPDDDEEYGRMNPTMTIGMGCHVLKDGSVYVTGMVEDGAHILMDLERHVPHVGNSILAARFDGQSGKVKWINQFGSNDGNEKLAQSGGIAVDNDENLIIFGDTTGSMFRPRGSNNNDGSSDIFLATLSKEDGSHDPIGSVVRSEPTPVPVPVVAPESTNPAIPVNHGGEMSDRKKWEDYINDNSDTIGNDYDWGKHDFGQFSIDDDNVNPLGYEDGKGHDYGGYGKDGDDRAFNTARFGIQSGPHSGSTFAGGMVYNADEDSVYLTGITYDDLNSQSPNCIVTKLPLEEGTNEEWSKATDKVFGNSDVIESCSSIALHRYGEVVTVGNGDTGSSLPSGSNAAIQGGLNAGAGFALAINRNNLGQIDSTPLVTTTPNDKIQYPISVVSDGDDLYVVSLTSTDSDTSREFNQLMANGGSNSNYSPNFLNIQKYGSSLDMTVTKVTLKDELIDGVPDGDISFTTAWSKEFPVNPDGDGSGTIPRVFLGGAIVKKSLGYLAIAGSTRGLGKGYGAAVGNDEDGFIILLDLQTGELSSEVDRNNIREGSAEDDIVLGICQDPDDNESFFVVGATKGLMGTTGTTKDVPQGSLQGFLRKVNAKTLAEIWTIQWGAIHKNEASQSIPTSVKASDCAVSGDVVYVGGVVDDNAEIYKGSSRRRSQGGDDIWVGAVTLEGGDVMWLRQAGSPGNDRIAPHGGLAISKNGNVIVFGDTNGAFYRERSQSTLRDLFVMEFGKNGLHKRHVRAPIGGNDSPATAPEPAAPTIQAVPVQLVPVAAPISSGNKNIPTFAIIGIIIVGALILIVVSYFVYRRLGCRRSKKTVDGDPDIEIKDGLITNKNSCFNDHPPQSSFSQENFNKESNFKEFGEDPLGGYSDKLSDEGKHVI